MRICKKSKPFVGNSNTDADAGTIYTHTMKVLVRVFVEVIPYRHWEDRKQQELEEEEGRY